MRSATTSIMSKSVDYKQLEKQCILVKIPVHDTNTQETINVMSKDVKAFNRLEQDRRARLTGIAAISGVAALFGGRAISRRFVAPRQGVSRPIVKVVTTGCVFSALFSVYLHFMCLMTDWVAGESRILT